MGWWSSGKPRFQRDITTIYSSTLGMTCAVLISVIFCSSRAHGWLGGNWGFWSKPFLIVHNAPVVIGTNFVLTFHILLISISRSLYLFSFSVSFVLRFE